MSEKENIISPSDEVRIVNAFKYWYETNTEKGVTSIPDYICKGLLALYNKEKEKNKELEEEAKKVILVPNGTNFILVPKDMILKSKIKEKIEELEKRKDEYTEQPLIYHILKNQLKELLEQ